MVETRTRKRLRHDATRAAITIAGVVASFCTVFFLCLRVNAPTEPAVVAAILAVGLGRRARPATVRGILPASATFAVVALAVTAIARLLFVAPIAGAVVFIAAIGASVALRDYGERARRIGATIALPLVALLVIPGPRSAMPGGPLAYAALTVVAGIVTLCITASIQALVVRLGHAANIDVPQSSIERSPRATRQLSAPQRMALQMVVALGAAFIVGFAAFPTHWSWVVLTAFIVCSGARGRGDALYTALLRLIGALTGTIAAGALTHLWSPSGPAEAIAIFAILFVGLWLRETTYAAWAFATTLILSLLAHAAADPDQTMLTSRLVAIVAGAICAIAATWLVFPIKTEDVIRSRLARVLRALDDLVAHADLPQEQLILKHTAFERQVRALEELEAPVRMHHRLLVRKPRANHPLIWIELAREMRERLSDRAIVANLSDIPRLRRTIGASRRSIADHTSRAAAIDTPTIASTLSVLRDRIANGVKEPSGPR